MKKTIIFTTDEHGWTQMFRWGILVLAVFNLSSCDLKVKTDNAPLMKMFSFFKLNGANGQTPTIIVKIGDTEYKNGDTFTFNVTKTNFDNPQIFTIVNKTSVNLNLTGSTKVVVGGTNTSNFSVVQPTLTTLIPGATSDFTLNFKTSDITDKTATITISNDDLSNPNYTLNIIGKCIPSSGSFILTGSMGTARYSHTATLLSNGKVLIAGGTSNNGVSLSSAEIYDMNTGTFTATGSMGTARASHTATLLSNGKVLVAGGLNASDLSSAELYDSSSGTFSITGNMGVGKSRHSATLLSNGKVLLVSANAELYNPDTGIFSSAGSMGVTRAYSAAVLLNNGKVLISGGTFPGQSSAELYDFSSGIFAPTAGNMNMARYNHTVTLLTNGKVLVVGGNPSGNSNVELYNPTTGIFNLTGNFRNGNVSTFHAATLLSNGKVLITRGTNNNTAELYDSDTGTFSVTGNMSAIRQSHTATLLTNGKVLIVGGFDISLYLSSAELYSP